MSIIQSSLIPVQKLNLEIRKNESFVLWLQFKNIDSSGLETPIDLTSLNLMMQIQDSSSTRSQAILFTLSTDNDRIKIDDATQGKVQLYISYEDILTIPAKTLRGKYDLVLIDSNDQRRVLAEGDIIFTSGVSK